MERHFEKDLNVVKERLLWMGSLAERAVHQSVHSVLDSDEQLAKRVLDEEDQINELQLEIDDRVVQVLALHQLMAADLRFVLAVSRINNDLERIGDQAVNIAQASVRILRHPRVKPYVDLPRMSEVAEEMVRDALNAVVRRDVELAQKVLAMDDQVDHYRDQIFRELLTYMMGDSSVVFPAFELILVAKNLERIGDQAVNIAQASVRILRHPRGKPYVDLPRMSEVAEEMVRDALNAVVRRDVELAQKVLAMDDQVDHYRDQIFRELLTYMMGDSSVVFPAFELILVAKNLERIGDHATNIAEDVIYIVQGQDVRHPTVDRR